ALGLGIRGLVALLATERRHHKRSAGEVSESHESPPVGWAHPTASCPGWSVTRSRRADRTPPRRRRRPSSGDARAAPPPTGPRGTRPPGASARTRWRRLR